MDVRKALLRHYDCHARDLPWRTETDPYRIWVSEVMLQQTRVETVIPYYRRWLEQFPDVDRLATADADEVLLAWQGLGYYRRARNLHAGASVVREQHGGRLPGNYEALRALPGVGEYTAGAVASIAFGEAVPAVDGNVKRVLARLYDEPAPSVTWLRRTATDLMDPVRPGDWNQALMELGATVCTPGTPRCGDCPVAEWCLALAAGTVDQRPAKATKRAVPARFFAVAVVVDSAGRALVVRRPEEGLLAGMWAFPDIPLEDGEAAPAAAADALAALNGVIIRVGPGAWTRDLPEVRHGFTHLDATYLPVLLAGEGAEDENRRWIPLAEPWPVALPVAQQRIARSAAAALTNDE